MIASNLRFTFEPLDRAKHDRAAFSCSVEALDTYLKKQAGQDVEKRVAAVIVATPDGKTIAGYYTLSQYAITVGDLPVDIYKQLSLPKYPVLPATLLGRLARASAFRGQGVGELLLMSALERSLRLSREIASVAVVVDAKDAQAAQFYSTYGFLKLPSHPGRQFLPMRTVAQIFR